MLKTFTHLQHLSIESENFPKGFKLTNRGILHLQSLKQLIHLELPKSVITDTGLELLKNLKNLEVLQLSSDQITDEGFEHISKMKVLRLLNISSKNIQGYGLRSLQGHSLKSLSLIGCSDISDENIFMYLNDLKELVSFSLIMHRRGFSYAAVEYLNQHKALKYLWISDVLNLNDESLLYFKGLKGLQMLGVSTKNITEAGLSALKLALPNCKVAD